MPDDSELLRRFAETKSEGAFAAFVHRHIGTVYSVALRRVGNDAHLAKDVAQEVFTDVARKAAALADRPAIVGWLFVATRYAAAKAVRSGRRQEAIRQEAFAMIDAERGSETPDWDGLRMVLDELVHRLGGDEREAVLLHFFQKLTYPEIGTRLGLSESGARMRVDRALGKIRLSLKRRGITSSAAAVAVGMSGQAAMSAPAGLAPAVATAATAGSAQSAAAAALFLMKLTKTQLALALGLALGGAVVIGVLQRRSIASLSDELRLVRTEDAAQTVGLRQQVAEERAKVAHLEEMSRRPGEKSVRSSDAHAGSHFDELTVVHVSDIMRDHPEYEALAQKEQRRSVIRQYGRAITALNLSLDAATKLKELLVERELASTDAQRAAIAAGFQSGSAEVNRAVAQAAKDSDDAIASLIGPDAIAKLEALKGTGMTYFGTGNEFDNATLDMLDAGLAVTPGQTEALAMARHNITDPKVNPRASEAGYHQADPMTWLSPYDQELIAASAAVLTPAQQRVLASALSADNQRQNIIKQYSRGGPMMITP